MPERDMTPGPIDEISEDELVQKLQALINNLKNHSINGAAWGAAASLLYSLDNSSGERQALLVILGGLTGGTVGGVIGFINNLKAEN